MSTPSQAEVRRMIAAAGTIVVKVGSSSLTQPSGHLDPDKLDALAAALAQVRLMGGRVVLVSSGAIAAGFGPLALTRGRWTWPLSRPPHRRPRATDGPLRDCVRSIRYSRRPDSDHLPKIRFVPPSTAMWNARWTVCLTSAWCRSSTKTIRWPRTRFASATTIDSPRWWPTWCGPKPWCY